MYNERCVDFMVTPNTVLTRWKLEDFSRVLEFEDLDIFLEEFWNSISGFNVEFDLICKALDCLEDDENFFTYSIYDNETGGFKTCNVSASDVLCKERLIKLARPVSETAFRCRTESIKTPVTEFLGKDENVQRALTFMEKLFSRTLSDGSYLNRERINKVRGKLSLYSKLHANDTEATFFECDRSLLFDALDELEKRCIF